MNWKKLPLPSACSLPMETHHSCLSVLIPGGQFVVQGQAEPFKGLWGKGLLLQLGLNDTPASASQEA